MEFNEKLASDICDKFGVSRKLIHNWRMRGGIPDKYDTSPEKLAKEKALKGGEAALIELFYSKEINQTAIFELAEFSDKRIKQIEKRKANFTNVELLRLNKELLLIKVQIQSCFSNFSETKLRILLRLNTINHFQIITDKTLIDMIDKIRNRNMRPNRKDYDALHNDYQNFQKKIKSFLPS